MHSSFIALIFSNFYLIMSRSSTYDGIDLMLNCEDVDQRDELTKNWRDHKLQELNFVGTVV